LIVDQWLKPLFEIAPGPSPLVEVKWPQVSPVGHAAGGGFLFPDVRDSLEAFPHCASRL